MVPLKMSLVFSSQIILLSIGVAVCMLSIPPDPKPENRNGRWKFKLGECPSDEHEMCDGWAREGRCKDEYKEYVRGLCRKSCALPCDKKRVTKPPPTKKKVECLDKQTNCAAYKESYNCNGEYKEWMKENCAQTCGFTCNTIPKTTKAPPSTKKCPDILSNCEAYKQSYGCNRDFEDWMKENCKKTCAFSCDAVPKTTKAPPPTTKVPPPTTKAPPKNCKDTNRMCNDWATQGECQKNPNWMLENCAKSCEVCKEKVTKAPPPRNCKDKSTDCAGWKVNGYCTNNVYQEYMKENCKKTCGFPCVSVTKAPSGTCGKPEVQWSPKFVVNGRDAKKGAWPWIASLQQRQRNGGYRHFCGGTLIKTNWVLTAAHCVGGLRRSVRGWSVTLGSHDHRSPDAFFQRIPIKRVIKHPNYNSRLLADFALLELSRPATLNARVTLACMPTRMPPMGDQCIVAGWGMKQYPGGGTASVLQQTILPVVNSVKCKHNLEVVCVGKGYKRGKQHPNACRGDSGGPLVCPLGGGRWAFVGVASYVYTYCKYYTGYAPVYKYLRWVNGYVERN